MSEMVKNLPEWLSVSRETQTKLQQLLDLLCRWNRTINLVSTNSLHQGWTRHILDSAQLWTVSRTTGGTWLDLGSGGGLPGLVIALIAKEKDPLMRLKLVESDQRKCVFLSEAARQLALDVNICNHRIEDLGTCAASVVSARALAPLAVLIGHAKLQLSQTGVALFPKGQNFGAELASAREQWHFDCEVIESRTESTAVVLRIENIEHV